MESEDRGCDAGSAVAEMLTYEQAASELNMKLGTLYAMVAQRRIPHIRLGRRLVRFSRTELRAWLNQKRIGAEGER